LWHVRKEIAERRRAWANGGGKKKCHVNSVVDGTSRVISQTKSRQHRVKTG